MLLHILEILHYAVLLVFGVYLSAFFLGICFNRKNLFCLLGVSSFIGLLQAISYGVLGIEKTQIIYPLITHLPLIVFLSFFFKKHIIPTIISVFSVYLCCQVTQWFGAVAFNLGLPLTIYYLIRIFTYIILGYLLIMYVSESMKLILTKPTKSLLILGSVPVIYYVFDYISTVYTSLLYSGDTVTVEFLPFVLCLSYLLFTALYFKEYEQKCEAQMTQKLIKIQSCQSVKEIETLKQSEYEMSILRHDMRHFLNQISSLIEHGTYDKALSYIHQIIETTDNTSIYKFCKNEMINMVLSFYKTKMADHCITFHVNTSIPQQLPCPEMEFSSILSNGLENALNAVSIIDSGEKYIDVNLVMNGDKLLLSIQNPCLHSPDFVNGLPITNDEGHGLGTQSIRYMTTKLHGNCQFTCKNNIFILRIIL